MESKNGIFLHFRAMTSSFLISLLVIFCVSALGGLIPMVVRMTHRRMQIALSLVSGVLVGISIFDLWPHSMGGFLASGLDVHASMQHVAWWTIGGFLSLFLLERFVCFHHHEVAGESCGHEHNTRWGGAMAGLCIHALLAGLALGAASHSTAALLGITIAIALHKPFDSLTLGTLLTADGRSVPLRHGVNLAYAFVTPIGALLGLWLGEMSGGATAGALAFATGMLFCIALSDLLPELQFHRHDRVVLTLALMAGLAISWSVTSLVDHEHHEQHEQHEDHEDHADEAVGHDEEHSSLISPGMGLGHGAMFVLADPDILCSLKNT